MKIFVFRSKKFFFDISISRGRTGEREVSTVPTRFPKQFVRFSFFGPKFFSWISQYLKVAQVKGMCQMYHRVALKSLREFSFFGLLIFYFNITIFRGHTGERKESTVPSRSPEPFARIFIFRSKNFYFNITIFRGRTGEREVSTVRTRCPEQLRAF